MAGYELVFKHEIGDEDELEDSDAYSDGDGDGLERVDLLEGLKTSNKKEIKDITRFSDKLLGVLKNVGEVRGEFAVSGQLDGYPLVPIDIKGYGKIGLPLYEEKIVTPLLKVFKKSPHGLKDKTILDESVRKSWELKENEFSIVNPDWEKYLQEKVIPQIAAGMKLEYNEIEAKLYKLLLYEPGSFFKPHRDSEKEDGMFASLIIQLPSKFTGGELIIRHDGEEKIFAFGNDEEKENEKSKEFSMFFAAFYCDLEHEVKPLVEGYRMCLVYNLISKVGDDQEEPKAPTTATDSEVKKFAKLVNDWKYLSPKKFIYMLSHEYTIDGLSLDGLKNGDRCLGQFMKDVSEKTDLCVALGILETQEHGAPFYADEGEGDPSMYSGSSKKMLKKLNYPLVQETYEVDLFVKNLRTLVGQVKINPKFVKSSNKDNRFYGGYNEISIPDDAMLVDFNNEVLKKESFKGILADKVDYSGWTGNEGVQMTRWYNKAVLVFWPKNHSVGEIWSATGDPPKEIVQETTAGKGKSSKNAASSTASVGASKKKPAAGKNDSAKIQPREIDQDTAKTKGTSSASNSKRKPAEKKTSASAKKPRTKTQARKGM